MDRNSFPYKANSNLARSSSVTAQFLGRSRNRLPMMSSALRLLLALVCACGTADAQWVRSRFHPNSAAASVTVTVDLSGSGNFTSIQQAIDWVPEGNGQWVRIQVKSGVYNEKVNIVWEKPFIYLVGSGRASTIIQWGDHGSVLNTSTFSVQADNFVASGVTFRNTYNKLILRTRDGGPMEQAPAAMIWGDKVSFYGCGFFGLQDTLGDMQGQHFYRKCYIEGVIDFIWGFGQSQFVGCSMYSKGASQGRSIPGFITAQGRSSPEESSGFVFKYCTVVGDGSTYLGRAYRAYSRVVFFKSYLGGNVVRRGWDAWNYKGKETSITYTEEGCFGPGSNKSNRVEWMKKLQRTELRRLLSTRLFIDKEGWIPAQLVGA